MPGFSKRWKKRHHLICGAATLYRGPRFQWSYSVQGRPRLSEWSQIRLCVWISMTMRVSRSAPSSLSAQVFRPISFMHSGLAQTDCCAIGQPAPLPAFENVWPLLLVSLNYSKGSRYASYVSQLFEKLKTCSWCLWTPCQPGFPGCATSSLPSLTSGAQTSARAKIK